VCFRGKRCIGVGKMKIKVNMVRTLRWGSMQVVWIGVTFDMAKGIN
jgi:hypothetical protein